ncbi:hypothetical protein EET67_10285 [Pseudaminobacter arsenicus]|uniref:Uncharacterized protein n=1 Tax=Borborobacter arsenicus TaxID=1851146 RepID=A0A432V753_9HYPH|nr:hypothetical protein [Pseudaminobacter arsenicus]RUM97991.1 hypothetical protein EET67_10285 [Pseudaminobacter arsenicus]
MLLCTAYLTATLVSFGTPEAPGTMEAWRQPILCPMIDAPMVLASLPEVHRAFDRFTVSLSASFYASLLYAAACPSPENCKLMPPAGQR